MLPKCLQSVLGIAALILTSGLVEADDRFWANATGGSFTDAGNWELGNVPDGNDTAIFSLVNSFGISLAADYSIDRFVQNEGDITLSSGFALNVTNPGAVESGVFKGALTLSGTGTHFNNETILVVGSGSLNSGTLNVLNGASLSSSDGWVGRSNGGSSGFVTVSGAGSSWDLSNQLAIGLFGNGDLQVLNGGFVDATSAVTIASRPGRIGVVEVSGAGSMIQSGGNFTVGSEGDGTLTIGAGGSVVSNGGTIGFAGIGNAVVSGENSNWNSGGMNIGQLGSGTLTISDDGRVDATTVLLGNTNNSSGVVTINSAGELNSTTARVGRNLGPGAATVSGGGSQWNNTGDFFVGSNSGAVGTLTIENGGSVTNDGAATVEASGTVLLDQAQFSAIGGTTNLGLISVVGDSQIGGAVVAETAGSIQVTNDSVATFNGDFVHNGGEILTKSGSESRFIGDVTGEGSFSGQGELFFEGMVGPGSSPGVFDFENDVTFTDTALLNIEIGGLGLTEFDHLLFGGDLSLDGGLAVSLINGFELADDQQFLIAGVAGDLIGEFNGLTDGDLVGSFGGQDLFITYGGSGITLFTVAVPEPNAVMVLGLMSFGLVLRRRR